MKDEIGLAMVKMSENGGGNNIVYYRREIKYSKGNNKTRMK